MTSIVVGKDRINLIESERYVAGTKNVYLMKVAFSEDWEGLEKKLVFKTDCFEIAVEVIGCSEQFPIPSEIFARPTTKLQVGAYAYRCNDLVLNTRWLSLGRVVKGTFNHHDHCGCEPPSKPSPDTYKVLRELIDGKADRLTFEDGQFILWAGDDPLSSFDAPIALPDGGTKGQVLTKASNLDGDYEWTTIESGLSLRVPVGTVLAWSGSLDDIPESYSLCDGQNGTLDLRYAFLIGASEELEPGTVVGGPIASMPMPLSLTPDDAGTPATSKPGTGSDVIEYEPQEGIRYYALAFIQKTSLTELDKKQGLSAFDIAKDNGFEGTEKEWLESLKGSDGKSAYDIAVEAGYKGSIEDFTNLVTDIINYDKPDDVIRDLTVTSINDLPTDTNSWYSFENVTFKVGKSRMDSLTFSKNLVYVDTTESDRLTLTTLDNHCYICMLDENGNITTIEEIASGTGGSGLPGIPGTPGKDGKDGKSAYELAQEAGFTGTLEEWLASLKGDQGNQGEKGEAGVDGSNGADGTNGKSAYEIAKDNGFEGTVTEWLASLKGDKGDKGDQGEPGKDGVVSGGDGEVIQGPKGDDGKSAYEIAKENGFTGTEAEWLASLKGDSGADGQNGSDGKSAYELAKEAGFTGTLEEWLDSIKGQDGKDGKSAYEIAVDNGFEGTEAEWLESLKPEATNIEFDNSKSNLGATNVQDAIDALNTKIGQSGTGGEAGTPGKDGKDGKSAYELAVEQGFEGTLDDWLNSLVGEPGTDGDPGKDGKSAYEIAVANGFDGTEAAWLESLKGADGKDGKDGDKGDKGDPGADGQNGSDGKSAYEIAKANGFTGTEAEWLESLKGPKGDKGESAYELAVKNGYSGTQAQWLESLKGAKGDKGEDGKSAYELAQESGYEGDLDTWLENAQGPAGKDGKSAYELAQDQGYEGTLQQWLDSLKGEGIAEFLTYADMTVTSRDALVAIDKPKSVHFERCKLAAADGNVAQFDDELVYIVPHDLSLEVYRSNGDVVTIEFGEDEIFSTLSVKRIEGNGSSGSGSTLIVSFPLDNPPIVGALYLLAPEDFNRTPVTGERVYGIVTVQNGNEEIPYYVEGSVQSATYNRVILDKVLKLGGGADGKSAYDIAVENGFIGTEAEWLESLKGEKGDAGSSIQKIDDLMHMGEYVVARWKDGRPLYRFDYMVEDMSASLTLTNMGSSNCYEITSFPNVDVIDLRGSFCYYDNGEPCDKYFYPYVLNGAHFELMWRGDEKNVVLRFEPINSSINSVTIEGDLIFSVWYTRDLDDEMDDSDLIVSNNTSGTTDHRELTNRDAVGQHPITAITGLNDKLAVVPTKSITNEEIDDLFK